MAELLRVVALKKTYVTKGGAISAIDDLSFEVHKGDFVCIVGPSGCGKTSLLMCLAGLIRATDGRVLLRGQDILGPPAGMTLVFQDYSRSLFPWRTVLQNVLFGVEKKVGLTRAEKLDMAGEALRSVGLETFGNHYPWELSGGMQQRVALARGIAYRPDIMLMDEPFASVDAQTRAELEDTLLALREKFALTILFVTHDIEEAIYLSERVLVLSQCPARILEQIPIELDRPRDQLLTREHWSFSKYRHQIYGMIKGQGRGRD